MFSQLQFLFHVYQLHALIYGLKFILELKKIIIKMALSKFDSFNFEISKLNYTTQLIV
jgi:hypothetical protein